MMYSLAWDGHHKTLVSVFEKLLESSHFEDCNIVADGQKLKAHKQVLTAFSPYFELLFSEETENNPTVIISGISFRDLRSLVDFMYQGKLEVTKDRIRDLIDAAECLQIKGLGGGHKENGSENTNNTKGLRERPVYSSGIPNKRSKAENKLAAKVFSKESNVNSVNFSNEIPHLNSVPVTCVPNQNSPILNLVPTSVQNVSSVSNVSFMPIQSTLSEIEMDSLPLNDELVIKKEPDPAGDENTNAPMRNTSSENHICGSSEISTENSGEETISGLYAYTSVPTERNVYEDLPSDCDCPAVLSSQLCSRDSSGFSVKNELCNVNMILPSLPLDAVDLAAEAQDPLYHSEFHVKTEPSAQNDNHLHTESENFSENTAQGIGVPSVSDVQMNDFSGAAHRDIPQELDAAFLKTQRIGRNEPVLRQMPGLPADVNPGDSLTHPSHTTPACDRDPSGPTGRGGSNGSISTGQQYRCQICGKTFARNGHLNVHMRIHAEDRSLRNDECNDAAVTFKLNKHQRILKGQKLYKCSVCEFKSADRSAFCVHLRVHSVMKPYKCTECEFRSACSQILKVHQQIHSGVKPYKCKECEYTCAKSSTLKVHQRIHSGLKPYKCTECDYTCARSSHLKRHQRIHSGVKPYKCSECDYAATSSTDLKMHQRRHSGVRPYKCSECHYAAASSSDLKIHQRRHSGVKPYKCSECSYAAVKKHSLKLHQRTHRLKP